MSGTQKSETAGESEERNAARLAVRRGQILEAATSVFARLGYHGARMDDIVRESGLSKGAIYWYFKGKEEIAVELVRQLLHAEEGLLESAKPGEDDPGVRLSAMADDFTHRLREDPVRAQLILELLSLGQRIPEIKKYFTSYHEAYVGILGGLLRSAAGGRVADRSVEAGALALAAMVDGWALHEALSVGPSGRREGLAEAVAVLVAGLRAESGEPPEGID